MHLLDGGERDADLLVQEFREEGHAIMFGSPIQWITEPWRHMNSSEHYPRGSKGKKSMRLEWHRTSRDVRKKAFLAGISLADDTECYLEEFDEGRHINPLETQKKPYWPQGQVKKSLNWMEQMEFLGDLARYNSFHFPSPSKLSQEILVVNGELDSWETREYLADSRKLCMPLMGSRTLSMVEDPYVHTTGPFYGVQIEDEQDSGAEETDYEQARHDENSAGVASRLLMALQTAKASGNWNGLKQQLESLDEYFIDKSAPVTQEDIEVGMAQSMVRDDQQSQSGHAEEIEVVMPLSFKHETDELFSDQLATELSGPSATSSPIQTELQFDEQRASPRFSPPALRPSRPSPNKARHYYQDLQIEDSSQSEYSDDEEEWSTPTHISPCARDAISKRQTSILRRSQSLPDLRANGITDIFTRPRVVTFSGVGPIPDAALLAPSMGELTANSPGLRRASTPFKDDPDTEDDVDISHINHSLRSYLDLDDGLDLAASSPDSNQFSHVPTMSLADQLMIAAFYQAQAEMDVLQHDDVVDGDSQGPLIRSPSTDNLIEAAELQEEHETSLSPSVDDYNSIVDQDAYETTFLNASSAYKQQHARNASVESAGSGSSGEVAQLMDFSINWSFESYDDDLQSSLDLDSLCNAGAISSHDGARTITFGPLYPLLDCCQQLCLAATWQSDADLLLETAALSADRQARAMIEKAFEQPSMLNVVLAADRVIDFADRAIRVTGKLPITDLNKPLPPVPPKQRVTRKRIGGVIGGILSSVKTKCEVAGTQLSQTMGNMIRKKTNAAMAMGKKKSYFIPH